METSPDEFEQPSRRRLLLHHFSRIEDTRKPEGVAHKLNEVLLLCVCATIADCDSFDAIAAWGEAHLGFLRQFLPYDWGVPSGRWLNLPMNRIDPELFAACFLDWVRECWPASPDTIAIDGKSVRRSHDRTSARAALHLVLSLRLRYASGSRAGTCRRQVQRDDRHTRPAREARRRPQPSGRPRDHRCDRLQSRNRQRHPRRRRGLPARRKGNQPTLQADIEAAFKAAEAGDIEVAPDIDKGHGRI